MNSPLEQCAIDYAWSQFRPVWKPHEKMTLEQFDALAQVAARTFWSAYRNARDVLSHMPQGGTNP